VKTCRLDGRQRSKKAVLRRLAAQLEFPDHFGGNLDALHDVLTTDLAGPLRIDWRLTGHARRSLGPDLGPILATLKDAAAERPDLTLNLEES